jgi:hypothetical protein
LNGVVPEAASPFFAGAKLIALVKVNNDVRPIAVGESLRRLAARLLLTPHRAALAAHLLPFGQVGVGVPGGIEAATHAARRLANTWQNSGRRGRAFLKIDLKNAFNEVDRQTIVETCMRDFVAALRFVWWLYSRHSFLIFGAVIILSACGVQQGDPLAPVIFSLVLARLWERCRTHGPNLDLATWFLDDGTLAGSPEELVACLEALAAEGRAVGCHINHRKCELVVIHAEDLDDTHALFPLIPRDSVRLAPEWELLGTPFGALDISRFAKVPALVARLTNAHAAFLLLRFCASYGTVVHIMRSRGPCPELGTFDEAVRAAVVTVLGTADARAFRPTRYGGLGLRLTSLHAGPAFVASATASSSLFPALLASPSSLAADGSAVAVLTLPELAPFPNVLESLRSYMAAGVGRFGDKKQREWSSMIELQRHTTALAVAAPLERARIMSCSGKHASAFLALPLCPNMPGTTLQPLTSDEFTALVRFRLGLPLAPEPTACVFCHCAAESDVYGLHSAACLGGGYRTLAHHTLRNHIFRLASSALGSPLLEVTPFPSAPSDRVDVLIRSEPITAVDVSIVSPLTATNVANAILTPGGAANAQELFKHGRYGAAARDAGIVLAPVICDMLGAWSPSALALITRLAKAKGARFGVTPSVAIAFEFREAAVTVQRAVARLLLANARVEGRPARLY